MNIHKDITYEFVNFIGIYPYTFLFLSNFNNLYLLFSLLLNLAKDLSVLVIFATNQLFISFILCIVVVSDFIDLCSAINYFPQSIDLGLVLFSLFQSLEMCQGICLHIAGFVSVGRAINSPARTDVILSHRLGFPMFPSSLNSRNLNYFFSDFFDDPFTTH